jgi:hypothetical protein
VLDRAFMQVQLCKNERAMHRIIDGWMQHTSCIMDHPALPNEATWVPSLSTTSTGRAAHCYAVGPRAKQANKQGDSCGCFQGSNKQGPTWIGSLNKGQQPVMSVMKQLPATDRYQPGNIPTRRCPTHFPSSTQSL